MLRGKTWHLQQAECRYTDDPKIAIDIWDKDAICNLVLGLNDEFIAESIDSQIKTAQILKIGSCACFFLLGIFAFRLERAKELRARLGVEISREALAAGEPHSELAPPPVDSRA
ncbi:hypothetical protein D3C86_1485370 [compost metagenome]